MTWVGARDTCVSKNYYIPYNLGPHGMACGNQNEKAEGNCKLRVWSQYYEIFEICSTLPK